uniref:Uncharacterized protein n=1 Tax=Renouxia sp. TaxID=2485823 RepID=A0A3G3MHS4_9FLOR|nr:hypothetical protein [Renouxia sp.]
MPKVYFITLSVCLMPFVIIITNQVVKVFVREGRLRILRRRQLSKNCTLDDRFNLAKLYTLRKQWFSSIRILEFCLQNKVEHKYIYLNALGFCYYNIKHYDSARDYYIKAIHYKKDYTLALNNLAKTYLSTENYSEALRIYELILDYSPDCMRVKENIKSLRSRDSRI